MYPTYHGVRVNGNTALNDDQTTLAEVFSGQGYSCGAFISAFVVDGRWGLKQGFELYDDKLDMSRSKHIDLGAIQRPGNQVMDSALAWLDGRKDRPFFAWIHLYDPHLPYEPPEPYRSEYGSGGPAGLYAGEIAFMDEQVGRLVAWLETDRARPRSTVLVLVGDHGEGLGSHGEGSHGYYIYDYAIHVPLIVVAPLEGLAGKRVPAQVRTADVFPTVLDLAGIERERETQGRSLVPRMFRPGAGREVPAYGESMAPNIQFGWSPLHVLRTSPLQVHRLAEGRALRHRRGSGRDDEPPRRGARHRPGHEGRPRRAHGGRPAAGRRRRRRPTSTRTRWRDSPRWATSEPPSRPGKPRAPPARWPIPRTSSWSSRRSRPPASWSPRTGTPRPCPCSSRPWPKSRAFPRPCSCSSTCYTELGRRDEAKSMLDAVLKDDPENVQALISLANILLDEHKDDDVIALCKQALSVDERNTQALQIIGEIYMGRLDFAQALPYIEQAADVQSKNDRSRFNLAACLIGLEAVRPGRADPPPGPRGLAEVAAGPVQPGPALEEQGRLEDARAAYAQEVETYPSEFKARFNLGKLLFKLGDRAGSLAEMREIVRIAPKLAEGHLFLARGLLYEDVPLDEVKASVDTGLALAETAELKAMGYFLLADIYNRTRQKDKMDEALRLANSYKAQKERS